MKLIGSPAVLALLLAAACGMADAPTERLPPGTTVVDWQVGASGVFTTVRDGQFIAWRSADGMHHTVTSGSTPPAFDDVDVPQGGTSAAVKLTTPGDYRYSCSIHGAAENGTIRVLVPGS